MSGARWRAAVGRRRRTRQLPPLLLLVLLQQQGCPLLERLREDRCAREEAWQGRRYA